MLSDLPTGLALDDLLQVVGPGVVALASEMDDSTRVVVSGTVIEDTADALELMPGGLLLLVGVLADDPGVLRSIERAGRAGFAGIVLKRRGRSLYAVVAAAQTAGLVVLIAPDEMAWRHLDALLSTAIGSAAATGAGEAGGDELFSIANAVAAVTGGSVAVEDLGRQVLAYSNVPGQRIDPVRRQGILDRQVPSGFDNPDDYGLVVASDGIVRFPEVGEDLARAAIALRAGTIPLGTMWAIEGEGEFSEQAERALIEGARLASLYLLRARNALDLDRLRREELLRGLLDAVGDPDSVWPRLGFRPGDRAAIIALAPRSPRLDPKDDPWLMTHVAGEVARVCHVLRPDAPLATSPNAVYVLVAGSDASSAAIRLAQRLVSDTVRTLGDRLHAAVSSAGSGPRSVPRLRDEVDQILRAAADHAVAPDVLTISDVHSSVLLAHLGDEFERHPELRHPALATLIAQDQKAGTSLVDSLLVWLECQQNVQTAASQLHVHPNTLRYRLRQIRSLTSIDLDDSDQRLAVWLELRLRRISSAIPQSATGPVR